MKRKHFLLLVITAVLLLAGCQQGTPLPTFPPPVAPTLTAQPTVLPVTKPALTVAPRPTAVPLTLAPTSAPLTSTPVPAPSTPTSIPPTPTPTPAPPTATPSLTPVPPSPTSWPTPPAYEELTQPWNLIGSYVNAINRREYKRAYGYFDFTNQSYADFVRGFSDTAHVTAVVWPPSWWEGAAGSMYTSVPTILIAMHKDGSEHYFVGCYMLHRTNPETAGKPTFWGINQAQSEMHAVGSPDGWALEYACKENHSFDVNVPFDDQSDPIAALTSYVDAINKRDYRRAYGYWESPTQSYEDFVQGFADTKSVVLAVRVPVWTEGAAGSFYAEIQTLLLAIHKDGSKHAFVGCYIMRTANPEMTGHPAKWMIYAADMAASPGNSSDVRLLHRCR